MSPLLRIAALAPLVLALAVPAEGSPAEETTHHADHAAHHAEAAADVPADGTAAESARFATDSVLREQMTGVRAAVGELAHHEMGHMGAEQARGFALDVESRVQTIIAECTLPPDADAALHAIIVPLLDAAIALKATPEDAAPVAAMRAALAEYARRFDDPGSAGGE